MNKDDFKMKYPIDIDEYPEEIAETLLAMIQKHDDIDDVEEIKKELVDGIYYVRTCAENSFNSNYFRVLYSVLAKIAESSLNRSGYYDRDDVEISKQGFVDFYESAVDDMFNKQDKGEEDDNLIYGNDVTIHWNGLYCNCGDGATPYNHILPALKSVIEETDD